MNDEHDLPDDDLAAIYGAAALRARISARIDAMERRLDAQIARFRAPHVSPRKRLQGTPLALQVLRTTITELLAEGELWWGDA